MPKLTGVAAVLVAVLLTGCAATPTPEPTTAEQSEPAEASPTQTPEPLVAETTEPATSEDQFLAYVRDNLPPDTVIPNATDDQLLAAGAKACELRASGTPTDQISVIEGEPANGVGYFDSSAVIVSGSGLYLCD